MCHYCALIKATLVHLNKGGQFDDYTTVRNQEVLVVRLGSTAGQTGRVDLPSTVVEESPPLPV